jgi:hypothetical protein
MALLFGIIVSQTRAELTPNDDMCRSDRHSRVGQWSEMANKEILRQYFFVRVGSG